MLLTNLQARPAVVNGFWRRSLSWWVSDILLTYFFIFFFPPLTVIERYAGEGFAVTAGSTKGREGVANTVNCIA
jgi:hypothetical protein